MRIVSSALLLGVFLCTADTTSTAAQPPLRLTDPERARFAAESLFRRFLARFAVRPEAARARYLLGLSLEAQGRGEEAAWIFRELWLTAPGSPYGETAGGGASR